MSDTPITALTMPKWGMSMVTGKIVDWLVEEGATLATGDELAEVETDKIVNVVEVQGNGVLRRRVAGVGDELPIGALLGVIAEADIAESEIDTFVDKFQENFVPAEVEETASEPLSVDVNGLSISYQKAGPEESDVTPVLFVHGFGGDSSSWMFNIADLAGARSVYTLDLPGHGTSPKKLGPDPFATLVSAVSGFIKTLNLGKVHLIGHSLGAAVAMAVAVQDPSLLASLTIVDAAGLSDRLAGGDYIQEFIHAERRKDMKPALQKLFANPSLVTREMINETLKYKRLEGVADVLTALARAVFPDGKQIHVFRDQLEDLPLPVAAIWGAEDQLTAPEDAQGMPENVRVHIIDQAGHMPHMEAAPQFNKILGAFLEEIE